MKKFFAVFVFVTVIQVVVDKNGKGDITLVFFARNVVGKFVDIVMIAVYYNVVSVKNHEIVIDVGENFIQFLFPSRRTGSRAEYDQNDINQ